MDTIEVSTEIITQTRDMVVRLDQKVSSLVDTLSPLSARMDKIEHRQYLVLTAGAVAIILMVVQTGKGGALLSAITNILS